MAQYETSSAPWSDRDKQRFVDDFPEITNFAEARRLVAERRPLLGIMIALLVSRGARIIRTLAPFPARHEQAPPFSLPALPASFVFEFRVGDDRTAIKGQRIWLHVVTDDWLTTKELVAEAPDMTISL